MSSLKLGTFKIQPDRVLDHLVYTIFLGRKAGTKEPWGSFQLGILWLLDSESKIKTNSFHTSLLFIDYSIKYKGTTGFFTEKLHFPTQLQKNAGKNSVQRGQQLLFPFPEKKWTGKTG